MIKFQNVSKRYPNGHVALRNVTLHLPDSEMAFLTGHSGAGKSTLLKLIIMAERTNQGQIFVNDRNISRLTRKHIPEIRQNIGMIFQDPKLLPSRTVFDNTALPLIVAGYRPQEIERRVCSVLEMVGLLKKKHCLPATLSSGEQQRVGIARAVVNRPKLILADEPTGNLDPKLSVEIMRLFQQLSHVGVTVLVATHDVSLISKAHEVFTLEQGQLVDGGYNG